MFWKIKHDPLILRFYFYEMVLHCLYKYLNKCFFNVVNFLPFIFLCIVLCGIPTYWVVFVCYSQGFYFLFQLFDDQNGQTIVRPSLFQKNVSTTLMLDAL